jgi:hypothetical protein
VSNATLTGNLVTEKDYRLTWLAGMGPGLLKNNLPYEPVDVGLLSFCYYM